MTRWRRETVALATALGLHVAMLSFLHLTRSESSSSSKPPEPPEPPGSTTWDIEFAAASEPETAAATEPMHEPALETPHSREAETAKVVARVTAGRSELEQLKPEAAVVVEGPREPEPEQ